MQDGPEFRHLIAFVTVAEECNFGKAAQRIHITQPALSAQIKQLEGWLGAKLFRRVPHGAELTEPGRNFLVYARRLLHLRQHALKAASRRHSEAEWPLRLGYSPFVNHDMVQEALLGYHEIVPEGHLNSSSDCTAKLIEMLTDGRLDAAIVTSPVQTKGLSEQRLCVDSLVLCLRRDSPFASHTQIPKEVIADKLRLLFNREYHPALHDRILRKFKRAGIELHPTETYSAPAEMQFLVKTQGCFGLVRDSASLDPQLITKPIRHLDLRVGTVLVCQRDQQRPILPMLAYRMMQQCVLPESVPRKPPHNSAVSPRPLLVETPTGTDLRGDRAS